MGPSDLGRWPPDWAAQLVGVSLVVVAGVALVGAACEAVWSALVWIFGG